MSASSDNLPRLVGLNHIALEVDNIETTLAFYGKFFNVHLRGRSDGRAFIDLGDQFIALFEGRHSPPDSHRHIGLVVDDKEAVHRLLEKHDVELLPGRFLDFLDPSGNRIQIIDYADVQFTKAADVLRGMGLDGLRKSEEATEELRKKDMAAK